MNYTKEKGVIVNRTKKCTCGCGGKDPWHARNFTRIVTVTSRSFDAHDYEDNGAKGLLTGTAARGFVQLPWGKQDVEQPAILGMSDGNVHNFCASKYDDVLPRWHVSRTTTD
tara:strand:- start:111 stop:446 length:336 start_codon:yes stop_codon:yes gene_type:complete